VPTLCAPRHTQAHTGTHTHTMHTHCCREGAAPLTVISREGLVRMVDDMDLLLEDQGLVLCLGLLRRAAADLAV